MTCWNRFQLRPNPENPSLIMAPSAPQPYPDLIPTEACISAQHSLAWHSLLFLEHTHTHIYPLSVPFMHFHLLAAIYPRNNCKYTRRLVMYIFPQSLSIVQIPHCQYFPIMKSSAHISKLAWEDFLYAFHLRPWEILREACALLCSLITIRHAIWLGILFFHVCFKAIPLNTT